MTKPSRSTVRRSGAAIRPPAGRPVWWRGGTRTQRPRAARGPRPRAAGARPTATDRGRRTGRESRRRRARSRPRSAAVPARSRPARRRSARHWGSEGRASWLVRSFRHAADRRPDAVRHGRQWVSFGASGASAEHAEHSRQTALRLEVTRTIEARFATMRGHLFLHQVDGDRGAAVVYEANVAAPRAGAWLVTW